jgi:DNA-binding NarL/FixJ family response regulator
MQKPKIILVDDHAIFRQGIKAMLTVEGIADVIGEAANGKEFLGLLETLNPDLVLMDIAMPVMNGIDATKKAIEIKPGLKILALTAFGEDEYYNKMIEAGVKGFIQKNSDITELEQAITTVTEGNNYLSNEILRKIIFNKEKGNTILPTDLTQRETEILRLVCQSLTNEEIAEKLFLSVYTVKGYRSTLLEKTGCKNVAGLVMYAIKNAIVEI